MRAAAYVVGPPDGPGAALTDLARGLGFPVVLPYAGLAAAETQAQQTPLLFFLFAAAADVGSTILEVWDGAQVQRFSANAWPCAMDGRVFAGGWQRNRDETDPAFLKVCDRLLHYKIAAPRPWQPKAVKLMLGATEDPPERQVPWPAEWPPAPAALKPKAAIPFCAPVSSDANTFSNQLLVARWGEIGRTALVIGPSTSAVIWDWYFDLPAPIATAGSDPVGAECAAVATP